MLEHFSEQLPLSLATGHAKAALAKLRELPRLKSSAPGTNGLLLLANAELAAGELDAATEHVSAALSEIRSSKWPELLKTKEVGAERIIGKALLAQGKATEALPHLAHAVELGIDLVDMERSSELADLYVALGRCELALGRRVAAQSRLDAARAIHRTHAQLGMHLRRPLAELAAALGGKVSGSKRDARDGSVSKVQR
jgi:tetratricopeptide (TPR) repeat protein